MKQFFIGLIFGMAISVHFANNNYGSHDAVLEGLACMEEQGLEQTSLEDKL